jgi:N-acetylmuramoyl-L-alanine amidase
MGLELAATERLRRGDRLAAAVCVAALVAGGVARASDTSRTVPTISSKHVAARALTPWEQAERGREELEAIPEGDRTRAQYMHALDAYRAIYHDAPGDQHAPAAVYAVAELLAEQGRGLHDRKSLEAAVGQYEFLRKQYPGSSLRVEALLAEGQIAQDDLQDAKAARAAYALLLKQYPRSAQAEEARAGLESLEQGSVAGVQGPGNRDQGSGSRGQRSANGAAEELGEPAGVGMPRAAGQQVGAVEVAPKLQVAEVHPVAAAVAQRSSSFGKRAVVTGIRHWSTATYTRVAIDLGDEVTYEAARVPNPDRIYFDLHGTKLAQDLVGKSFAVTDDGFLKRIRAAQSSDDVTRVVLDVSDVSDYSAFLLPNPYRLIIDIHGRAPGQAAPQYTEAPEGPSTLPAMPVTGASVTAAEVPAPHAAGMVRSTVAKPVPNTMTVRQANSADVAAVSQTPGRVEATTRPTSQPISAVVPGAGTTRQAAGATEAVASVTRETVVTAQGTPIEQAPASVGMTPARWARTGSKRKMWCWMWRCGWASCCTTGWARRSSTRARTTRSSRSRRARRLRTRRRRTCFFRSMRTRRATQRRGAWRPTT